MLPKLKSMHHLNSPKRNDDNDDDELFFGVAD